MKQWLSFKSPDADATTMGQSDEEIAKIESRMFGRFVILYINKGKMYLKLCGRKAEAVRDGLNAINQEANRQGTKFLVDRIFYCHTTGVLQSYKVQEHGKAATAIVSTEEYHM